MKVIFLTFLFYFEYVENINVYIDTSIPIYSVSERFLGVTLDTGMSASANWRGLNFT